MTLSNLLFDSNDFGLSVGKGSQILTDLTFNRNIYSALSIYPEDKMQIQKIVYGTLAENKANGFESVALGFRWLGGWGGGSDSSVDPPYRVITVRQINEIYRGSIEEENRIINIPYTKVNDFEVEDSQAQFNFEPGVIVKMGPLDPRSFVLENCLVVNAPVFGSGYIKARNKGKIMISGDNCKQVTFTSVYDDTIGGDTNLDGNATSPQKGNYKGFIVDDTGYATTTYAEILYATDGFDMYSGNLSAERTSFKNNVNGIYARSNESPIVNLSESNFINNTLCH